MRSLVLPRCGTRDLSCARLLLLCLAVFCAPLIGAPAAIAGETNEECESLPSCSVTPNVEEIEVFIGEPFSMTICGVSNCGNDVRIESWRFNPDWCPPVDVKGSDRGVAPGEELCIDLICTPPITAAIGPRLFKYKIIDEGTGEYVWCEFWVRTKVPCLDVPMCRTNPAGVVEVVAGETFSFDYCASSECQEHEFTLVPVMVPDWCSMAPGMMNTELTMPPGGERCFTIECAPPVDTPPDRYWIKIKVLDLNTGLSETCVIDIDVLEPPCDEPPSCEIDSLVPAGLPGSNDSETFNIMEGDRDGFQICGTSFCGNDISIDTSDLPEFCQVSIDGADGRNGPEGSHTECVWIDCEPEDGDAGSYHSTIWVTDLGNGKRSRCDIWINVESLCENEPPHCYLEGAAAPRNGSHSPPIRVQVGVPFDFTVCGETACNDHAARLAPSSLPPFLTNPGHRNGQPGEEVCLEVHGEADPTDVGNWTARFEVKDLQTGLTSICTVPIIVEGEPVCEDRPTCSIDPMGEIIAAQGSTQSIEICGAPICEEHAVEIEAVELPDFCDPFETVAGEAGEMACATIDCTIPSDLPAGTYTLKFRVRDTTNLTSSICQVDLVVPAPVQLGCFEDDQANDDITACSMFDAGDCFDIGCGASITGMLDSSGSDFDYYCVAGLEPLSTYNVTVIGGFSPEGMPGCYAIACLDLDGMIINSTNSGQAMGYPTIECVADSDGFVYFAVSGCTDLDIDGFEDSESNERGGIGHGSRGSYTLAVNLNFSNPTEATLACHADMNGDGIVDSSDLGMLIGMFGLSCEPR